MSLRRTIGRLVTPPLIAGILALHVDGCATGGSRAVGLTDLRTTRENRVYRVPAGSDLEITRRDGTILRGHFRGTARMSDEEYAHHRSAYVLPPGADSIALLPRGAPIEIQPRRGRPYSARFAAFALGGIELERDSTSIATVAYTALDEIRGGSRSRTGTELASDVIHGGLPLSTVVRLGVANGEVTVPADQIAEATVRDDHGNEVAVGIVVGVLVAIVAGAFLALYIIGHSIDEGCASFPTGNGAPSLGLASVPAGPVIMERRAPSRGSRP